MFKTLAWVTALLGTLWAGLAQATNFDAWYVARYGHANGDQLTDIYLQYRPKVVPISLDDLAIPIPLSRREVGDFVLLQQANGTFSPAAVTAAQLTAFAAWPTAPLKVLLSDIDSDNNLDLVLKNVSSIVPAAKDIIVYAPTVMGAQPAEVRPVDDALVKFIRDLQGWAEDHQSYYANAWVNAVVGYRPVMVNFYDCSRIGGASFLQYDETSPGDGEARSRCQLLYSVLDQRPIYGSVFNTRDYSWAAKVVADTLAPFSDATTPVSDAAMQTVIAQISTTIGRPWYPDVQPGSADWEDLRKILKVLARGAARASVVVGGVLYPSETADSDRSDEFEVQSEVDAAGTTDASRDDGYLYFYHATLTKYVASILSGISVPPKRNYLGDEPGFYLATNRVWAYTFAREVFGKFQSWTTIEFRMTTSAHSALLAGGARYRFHPPLVGTLLQHTTYELIVPPHMYGTFNSLMASGQIVATPLSVFRY